MDYECYEYDQQKREEGKVESTMAEDVRRLVNDNDRLRLRLERLEQDHAAWALRREEKDIRELMDLLQQIEVDVNEMASDCFSLKSRKNGNEFEQVLHHAYAHLNILFEDVKKARMDLEQAYIQPLELRQMEIDWGKLRKTVGEIAHHLRE
jgi:hypothetical protein